MNDKLLNRLAGGLVVLASLEYFAVSLWAAAGHPLWMDEVLAVWTVRQPGFAAIWRTLEGGAEFSPPLYHWALHLLFRLGATSDLALRVPSILAVYGVGLCAYALVRRRASPLLAALALTACLASGLGLYAVQIRQYAAVSLCFALALLAWDGAGERPSPRRAVLLGAALIAAVGLHFYAVLLAASVGLIELLWMIRHRRIRWPFVAAVAAGGLSLALWLPIVLGVSRFNQGDVHAAAYYARPTVTGLAFGYVDGLAGHQAVALSPLVVLAWAGLFALALKLKAGPRAEPGPRDDIDLVIGVCGLIPLLVFVFALVVTHTFNSRYVVASAVGLAVLIALSVKALPSSPLIAAVAAALLTAGMASPLRTAGMMAEEGKALALVAAAPGREPIFTANGLRYLELRENLPPKIAARVVYVLDPLGYVSPDPTNLHQVQRWLAMDPKLAAIAAAALPRGALVYSDDSAVDFLAERVLAAKPVAADGAARLARLD